MYAKGCEGASKQYNVNMKDYAGFRGEIEAASIEFHLGKCVHRIFVSEEYFSLIENPNQVPLDTIITEANRVWR